MSETITERKINTLNNITSAELCEKLKVVDMRTLQTADGFPKPFFDEGELMFKKEDISKYFNIDNIDEPFMTLKEAAEFLNMNPSSVQSLSLNNKIPSYRLKSSKGSGYLYRKSELDKFNKVTIEGNTEFINYFVSNKIMKDLFMNFIDTIYNDDSSEITKRGYDVVCKYFFNNFSFKEISDTMDISRERVKQIFNRTIRHIKHSKHYPSKDTIILEKKILHQDIEIKHLRSRLYTPETDDESKQIDYMVEIFVSFLSKKLVDFDLSVRTLNVLSLDYYNIYYLLSNHNSYNNKIKDLKKLRNFGQKSFNEITDFISEQENKLEKLTNINPQEFFSNTPVCEKNYLIFQKVHSTMKLSKNK